MMCWINEIKGDDLTHFFFFLKACCAYCLCLLQGEKYLALKKRYRQMLHERDAKPTDKDAQRQLGLARPPAVVPWDATDAATCSPQQKRRQDEPPSRGEANSAAEVNLKTSLLSCSVLVNCETS